MKWIGQHIWDFVSRFRNDVYLETLTENFDEFTVVIGNDNKLYKSTAPSEKSRIQVRNDEGSTIPAGSPLYSKGEIGGSERIKVGICVSSDPAKMPCIGIAEFEMNTTDTKDSFAITQGVYNTNISGFTGLTVGDNLYVNGGSAPHLTPTKPTNGDLIQNVGVVLKTNGTICQGLLVSAIGRTNDVPWPLYVDHTTQRVGIGTASPDHKFHIEFTNGDTSFSGGGLGNWGSDGIRIENASSIVDTMAMLQFRNADADIHIAGIRQGTNDSDLGFFFEGSEKMRIDSSGKVGIGTTSPNKNFTVEWLSNNTVVDSGEGLGGGTAGSGVLIQNGSYVANTYANLDFRAGNADGRIAYKYNSINDGDFHFITDNGNNPETKLFIENNGNVGIGTTSPSQKLHVIGDARIQGNLTVNGTYTQIDTDVLTTEQWLVTNDGTGPAAVINQLGSQDIFDVQDDGTSVFYIKDGGKVGIGTTNPLQELQVDGSIYANGGDLYVNNGKALISVGDLLFKTFESGAYHERARILANGNVGIGTTSPQQLLDITNTTAAPVLRLSRNQNLGSTSWAGQSMGDIEFYTNDPSSAAVYGKISLVGGPDSGTPNVGYPDGHMTFFTRGQQGGDSLSERMRITDTGNVGIGTSSPDTFLHIKKPNSGGDYIHLERDGQRTFAISGDDQSTNKDFSIKDITAGTRPFLIAGLTGNVGINTQNNNPSEKLEVVGNVQADSYKIGGATILSGSANVSLGSSGATGTISLNTHTSTALYVAGDDNVGIGTTSPGKLLDVNGTFRASGEAFLTGGFDITAAGRFRDGIAVNFNTNRTARIFTDTNDLIIQQGEDDKDIIFNCDDGSGGVTEYLRIDGSNGYTVANKQIRFNDNVIAKFGSAGDLSIYHNGTDSVIDNFTGDFYISQKAADKDLIFRADDGAGGFETYFFLDGSEGVVNFPDDKRLTFGTGRDLFLYHDGTNGVFRNFVGDIVIKNEANDKDIIFQSDDGSGGITAYLTIDGGLGHTTIDKRLRANDNVDFAVGTGNDLRLVHDGTHSYMTNYTGDFYIANHSDDKDIIFQSDDGSGGLAAYLTLDGSSGYTKAHKHILYEDNAKAMFGTGGDMQILHDGSNSYISHNVTGHLYIENNANDQDVIFRCDDGSGGTTDYFKLDGGDAIVKFSKDAKHLDSVKSTFGDANDLQIYHDGSDSYIKDAGTGNLKVMANNLYLQNAIGENYINCYSDDRVEIFHNNVKKLETTSTGVDVTGDVVASGTLIAKQYQAFQCNFINDISTTKYYLPLETVAAQTVRYQDEACMLAHADGRLASVTLKVENLNGASGNITFGIEVLQSTGTGYSGTWTVVETETMAIASTHNHDVFHFHFSTAKHFDSTHMFAISIQSDNAALGGEGGNDERWFVTPVIEWDYNTYLGTNGTSTRYDTTP